ncbi:MAG: methylenetetrahydrofolate reductase C-terminal domain-containing protein [Candidatus Omnitrophota bacterium]
MVLAGKTVTGLVVPEVSCVASKIKLALGKNRELLKDTQVILVFACGSAVASVQENDRLGLRVLPGCDTLFGAIIDGAGNFAERCSACGECLLDVTEGVCPVTRCSKGVLNCPCGGVKDGKCEVDKDRDCAWVLIYRRFKDKGQLDKFVKINKPKDYSRSVKPRHI